MKATTIRLNHCWRCGGNHERILAIPLANARHDETSHYGICPTTGHPIALGDVFIEVGDVVRTHHLASDLNVIGVHGEYVWVEWPEKKGSGDKTFVFPKDELVLIFNGNDDK